LCVSSPRVVFNSFSVRRLSVLRGHSVFSTSDFEGFCIPDLIHYIYVPILILEKEFGMTRSLTGD